MSSESTYLDESIWSEDVPIKDQLALDSDEVADYEISDEDLHFNELEEELDMLVESHIQERQNYEDLLDANAFEPKRNHHQENKGIRKRGRKSYRSSHDKKKRQRGITERRLAKNHQDSWYYANISMNAQKKSSSHYPYRHHDPSNNLTPTEILIAIAEIEEDISQVGKPYYEFYSLDTEEKDKPKKRRVDFFDKVIKGKNAELKTKREESVNTEDKVVKIDPTAIRFVGHTFDIDERHSYREPERNSLDLRSRLIKAAELRKKREHMDRVLGRETVLASELISCIEP